MNHKISAVLLKSLLLTAAASLVFACKVDDRYRIYDLDDTLDTEMTLFGEGITVPLGKTKPIRVDSLLALAGEENQDFLTLAKDGTYSIRLEDSIDLSDELSDLDLTSFASIDGVSFNEQFEYKIGDFNVEDLTVEGTSYSTSIVFDEIANVKDIKVKAFDESETMDFCISDYVSKDDLKVSVDPFSESFTVMRKIVVSEEVEKYASTSTVPVDLSGLLPSTIDVSQEAETLQFADVVLDENIASISNVRFGPDSRINVKVSLVRPFLTAGIITPDISIDLSDIFKIKDVDGPLTFTKPLTVNNGWSTTYSFTPEYLSQSVFTGNRISVDKKVKVDGVLYVSEPYTTGQQYFSCDDTGMSVEVSFDNIEISSAAVELAGTQTTSETTFEVPLDFGPFEVPEQVKHITVLMDESNPVSLTLSATGLSSMKNLTVTPDIAVQFPSNMVVDGTDANGVLHLSGNISNGSLNDDLVLKSFSIAPVNGVVEYHGKIVVNASASATGSFDVADIPDDDPVLTASVKGAPAVADYRITLDPITEDLAYSQDCSFDVPGIGSFGSFSVYPEGNDNKIELSVDMPDVRGVLISAKEPGIKATFPPYVVFKNLDPSLNFNAADNSIILKGELPHSIVLPIEKLSLSPVAVGDTYHIDGAIDISGCVEASPLASDGTINKETIEDISGQTITLKADVPTLRAQRVELDGDFDFEFEQDLEEMTFLAAEDIPEQLQSISELLLNDVFANVNVNVKDLPDLGSSRFKLHLEVTLPEMVDPSVIIIDKELESDGPGSVSTEISEQILALRDIDFTTGEDIAGKISVKGSLKAVKPHIEDIATLKSAITCNIAGSLGNDEGKISVGNVTGRVKYDFNTEMTTELDGVPDILKGDDIVLDILPELSLSMTTNIGVPVVGSIVIVPFIGDEAIESNKVVISNVVLPYSTDGKEVTKGFFIARDASASCPEGYEPINQNLSSLIRQIPDKIKVSVEGGVDSSKDCVVNPATEYTCKLDYAMNVPLKFGDEFTATITKDFDLPEYDLGANSILFTGTVTNSTPLDLNLVIAILDENGAEVNVGDQASIAIPSCDAQGNAVETPISFGVDLTNCGDAVMKTARLTFHLGAQAGIAVQNEDFFQVELFASLPHGFTFNIDDIQIEHEHEYEQEEQ